MFDVDLSVLTKVLNVPQEKIDSKATKSVRKSVTNIKPYLSEEYQQLSTKNLEINCSVIFMTSTTLRKSKKRNQING